MGAQTVLTPPRLPVQPGAEVGAQLTVTNVGRVVDSFTLEVLGPAGAWSVCEPATVSLLPGQSETVQVLFRPPAGGDVPAGELLFGVHARSHEDPQGSVAVEGTLDIAALPLVSAEISPRTDRARGRRASRHRVAVDNRGNAPVLVTLAGFDEQDAVDVAVDPAQVEVGAGSAAFVSVRARGVHGFWRGPAQTHPFAVEVNPEGATPFRLNATLMQEAAVPAWLPKAAMAAAALAVAFALFWYGMFRPTIKDTATAAAQHAAQAAVKSAVSSANAQLGGGTGRSGGGTGGSGGSGSQTPGPTPTPSASTASPQPQPHSAAPAPVPFATQLAGANTDLVAATKKTVSVTDLLLQNPAADDGLLTITGSGSPLMTVRLSDFRDYDLHLVTPIVVPSGQALSMNVTCQNKAPKNPTCSASVFVSGVVTTAAP